MLKVPPDSEVFVEWMKQHNLFDVEAQMYNNVVPEMEEMYKSAGCNIRFGAQGYKLQTDNNYILLEDLRPYGFKNADRLNGLDENHTKNVLKKLAQWHAATATRVAKKGLYPKLITQGYFKETSKPLMEDMWNSNLPIYYQAIEHYKGHEEYIKQTKQFLPQVIDELFNNTNYDESEFNVLNHGDVWCNNVMFKYKENGEIEETFLVDYQLSKYGSPAQDLFYFLLSSTQLDIKIDKFDALIQYYYDQLIEHLKLLKYPKQFPMLREIHSALYKHSIWGELIDTDII